MKKILAFALCLVMVLSLSTMAFAAEEKSITLTADNLVGPNQTAYGTGTKTIDGVDFSYTELGNFGNGIQMRIKNGNTATLWNDTAVPGEITKIVLVYSANKDVQYSNPDAFSFKFGAAADALNQEVKLSTEAGVKEYTITAPAGCTFFKMELLLTYSFYWDSITIYYKEAETPTNPTDPSEPTNPVDPEVPAPTGDMIAVALVALTVSGMGITAVASKKKEF